MPERFVCHDRPEIGPSDADVDHVADPLAGVPPPGPVAHTGGEGRHLIENGVHLGHHVLTIHHDLLLSRCPQGHVEHRALLGGVDLVAPEHRIDAVAQSHRFGQPHEQAKGLVGHAVL